MASSSSSFSAAFLNRMKREIQLLTESPPPGVAAWPQSVSLSNDLEQHNSSPPIYTSLNNLHELDLIHAKLDHWVAQISGPKGTPYENGVFFLDIKLSPRYPFDPPTVTFNTKVYHPNIDDAGRICLDTLNMPPKGAWRPSINLSTLLTTILVLLGQPNPQDGLMIDITEEYIKNRPRFLEKARQHTFRYACSNFVNNQNPFNSSKTATVTPQAASSELRQSNSQNISLSSLKRKRTSLRNDQICDMNNRAATPSPSEKEESSQTHGDSASDSKSMKR